MDEDRDHITAALIPVDLIGLRMVPNTSYMTVTAFHDPGLGLEDYYDQLEGEEFPAIIPIIEYPLSMN